MVGWMVLWVVGGFSYPIIWAFEAGGATVKCDSE